ncbi:MAG: DUF5615 family PIN-like protein [Fimbriimonadaceae bacterium]|nr:DUF5615 family PIN-like protein [Fimbriimonadaceae bacterium]
MKQILIDENLPPGLTRVFAQAGITAQHVYESGLTGGSDLALWNQALLLEAAIATKDVDFIDLVAIRNEGQVVLFKVGNMRIGEVLRFAATQIETIIEFLSSEDQVLVLRS